MEWLNYHHLLYFWTVVREGGVTQAAKRLRLAQPTVSGQLRALEASLGAKLYTRSGRRLLLTDVGQTVYRYADEIFGLGRELQEAVRGRGTGKPLKLVVGVADVLPKLVTYRLLEPALRLEPKVQLVVREDRPERLVADLAVHELDLVLSDAPVGPHLKVRVYNHLLGECGVTFFAAPELASRLARGFPRSLDGAPFLLPSEGTALRAALERWLDGEGVRPAPVAECQDAALLAVFCARGAGAFAAPTAVEAEMKAQYRVRVIGRSEAVRERFFAISGERRLRHPAVVAISESARGELFG